MNIKLLLENVVQGKQTETEEMLSGNETLALERGIVTDQSNRSFNLSAIQYVTWALDTDMLEALVKNLTPDQKIQAAQQMEDLEKNHPQYSQYGANSEQIILNLIKVLNNYPVEESEESRCSRIGGVQRGLPINVINEYCNPLHHQKKSLDKLPRGIQVCIYHKVEQSALFQSSFSGVPCFPSEESGLGKEFFLSALWPKYPLYLAGTLGQGVRNTTPQIIKDDIHNLNELLKSRKSKILEIKNLLKGTPVLKESEEKMVASPLPFSTAIRKPQKEFVIQPPELPEFLRTTKCDYHFFNPGTSLSVDQLTKDMMSINLNTKKISTSSSWELEEGDEKILDADPMQSVEPPKEPAKKIANRKPTKILSQKAENLPNDALLVDGSKSANTLLIEFQKKQNLETSNFRFPAASNPHGMFTSQRLTLETLLQRAEISFKNVLDKPIVEIKFFELEYAKYFQSELMEKQIKDSNFPEKPRKIETPQNGEYDFNLRPEEYYAISGDESVIAFGSKSFFGSGYSTTLTASFLPNGQ